MTHALTRRAALTGATALATTAALAAPAAAGKSVSLTDLPTSDCELIGLVDEWLQVERELAEAACPLADLEDAARPDRPEPDGGTDVHGRTVFWADREELVAYWIKRLETMAGHPQLAQWQRWREEALQEFDAWHAEMEANRQANGAAALEVHVTALEDRRQEIVEAVHLTAATTLAGVLAKLQMVAQENEWRDPGEWTRRLQAAALADLERLAAGEGRPS